MGSKKYDDYCRQAELDYLKEISEENNQKAPLEINEESRTLVSLSKKDLSLIKLAIKLAIEEIQHKNGEYPDVYRYDYCIRNNENKIRKLKELSIKLRQHKIKRS